MGSCRRQSCHVGLSSGAVPQFSSPHFLLAPTCNRPSAVAKNTETVLIASPLTSLEVAAMDSGSCSAAFMRGEYSNLVNSIEATSSAVRNLARKNRKARSDLATLSHQLVGLGSVLDLWQHEGSTSDDVHRAVRPVFPRIQRILEHCHEVLLEIDGLLEANAQSHDWGDTIQTALDGFFKQLDAYTLSLDIALVMACL